MRQEMPVDNVGIAGSANVRLSEHLAVSRGSFKQPLQLDAIRSRAAKTYRTGRPPQPSQVFPERCALFPHARKILYISSPYYLPGTSARYQSIAVVSRFFTPTRH